MNYNGSFLVDKGEYLATNIFKNLVSKSVESSTLFSDFTYDARIRIGATGDGGLLFRTGKFSMGSNEFTGYYVGISAAHKNIILAKANNNWDILATTPVNMVANTWYQVRVVAKGTTIRIYVDDINTPKISFSDTSFASGSIGVRSADSITRWDNISVKGLE